MQANVQEIKRLLKTCSFHKIFIEELGWTRLDEAPPVALYKDQQYRFAPLAHKAGFKIYLYTFETQIPGEQMLKLIDGLANVYAEAHLTIFVDAKRENQAWLWVKKEVNQPPVARLNRLNKMQSGELLAQKVANLFISLDEEEDVTHITVLDRVIKGFDVEKITSRFYEHFQKERADFLQRIENIPDNDDRSWYTSIMLTRLMFVYFIQKKGLLDNRSSIRLDGDHRYLQNRLQKVRSEYGADNFYAFYRYFLRRLFHDGLNQPDQMRSPALEGIIGRVPYINGGLFDTHVLELRYPDIQISDQAFGQLFRFFEQFDWHLDDRPMRNDQEINPDVLGYIFEKYINQKQMGAYYTKEDITEYISKNTIIPFVFERVAQRCPDAFLADGAIWLQLRNNPDDYIYEELAHGLLEPLPQWVEAGIADITQRSSWNRIADEQWALPTETWREVIERRQRHRDLHTKIVKGELNTINDLITHNLNIAQFTRDVITTCQEPALLHAFYDAISQVTVLDPTCGSGAFLFAALNVLKPLYQACIGRMRKLVTQYEKQGKKSNNIPAFQAVLKRIEQRNNQEYFILKSIIINNLYGVDIMEEAIEICKLRLFLKLVAQIEKPQHLEPLPDIDFNVLVGNTLIGFTSLDEIRRVVTTKLLNIGDTERTLEQIEQDVKAIERDEQSFRNLQIRQGMDIDASLSEHKQSLRAQLERLRSKLDPYLATEYAIYEGKYPDKDTYDKAYVQWKKSHKPFHWWAEFYKIMNNGGFDVIIGNPPYVEYHEVKKQYEISAYKTENCGNLYAFAVEKMRALLGKQGRFGVIIPVASVCTDGYVTLQRLLTEGGSLVISSYNDRPSKLFEGLEHIRLSIILYHKSDSETNAIFTTKYNKWNKEERDMLFNCLTYVNTTALIKIGSIPKLQSEIEKNILQKILLQKKTLSFYARKSSKNLIYYTRKLSGFIQVLDHVPLIYDSQGQRREPSELKSMAFETPDIRNVFLSLLNSNLFYWFLTIYSDCRNLNKREIYTINFDIERASQKKLQELSELSNKLMRDLDDHAKMLEMNYKKLGRLRIQCFYPKYSKPIIDEIDRILAQHYGFTPEELDFIINYDIKYRMGRDNGDESEE